jgi:hypothetical protein
MIGATAIQALPLRHAASEDTIGGNLRFMLALGFSTLSGL